METVGPNEDLRIYVSFLGYDVAAILKMTDLPCSVSASYSSVCMLSHLAGQSRRPKVVKECALSHHLLWHRCQGCG